MIIDLFLDFGNPTMKSIEMLVHATGITGKGWSSLGGFTISLMSLKNATLFHKGVDVLLHAFP